MRYTWGARGAGCAVLLWGWADKAIAIICIPLAIPSPRDVKQVVILDMESSNDLFHCSKDFTISLFIRRFSLAVFINSWSRCAWDEVFSCLVPRPHYYARPMRFRSRGPREFLRPRQTRRREIFCLTWGEIFGSGWAVNNFSALMKDIQQPWRAQRIKPGKPSIFILCTFSLLKVLAFGPFFFIYLIKLIWTLFHLKTY